jgi:hypothetical protein
MARRLAGHSLVNGALPGGETRRWMRTQLGLDSRGLADVTADPFIDLLAFYPGCLLPEQANAKGSAYY